MTNTRDAAIAAELRADVEQVGGRLTVAVTTLTALFAVDDLSAESLRRIESALTDAELSVEPRLAQVAGRDDVALSLTNQWRPERPSDRPEAGEPATAPPAVAPAETVAGQAAALPATVMGAGALAPGVIAALLGFTAWWGYGLLFLVLTGAAWWGVGRFRFGLARVFLYPFRSIRLAAFTLGVAPMLIAIALLSVAVVAPVSAKRAADTRERDARSLVAQANRALARDDVDEAERLLADAERKDRGVSGYAEARR